MYNTVIAMGFLFWVFMIVGHDLISLSCTEWTHTLDRVRLQWSLRGGCSALPARSQDRGTDQCKAGDYK